MSKATSPARAHRLVRGGTWLLELALALEGAALLVLAGLPGGVASGLALGVLVVGSAACTVAAGGTPFRRLTGHRVVALDGGRAPVLGALARELLRLVAGTCVLLSVGLTGIDRTQRADLRWSSLTGTGLVGVPRARAAGLLGALAAVVALAGGVGAVTTGSSLVAVLGAVAAVAGVEATIALLVGRAEVAHAARTGTLTDISEPVPDDGSVEIEEDVHLRWWPPAPVVSDEAVAGDRLTPPRAQDDDAPPA